MSPYFLMNLETLERCLLAWPTTSNKGKSCCKDIGKSSAIQHLPLIFFGLTFFSPFESFRHPEIKRSVQAGLTCCEGGGVVNPWLEIELGRTAVSTTLSSEMFMFKYCSKVESAGTSKFDFSLVTAIIFAEASYTTVFHFSILSVCCEVNHPFIGLKLKKHVFWNSVKLRL